MSSNTTPASDLWPGGHPLDRVFGSPSHVRVLRALDDLRADEALTARRIALLAAVSHPRAGKILKELGTMGLTRSWWGRNHSTHRPNRRHELWSLLSSIFDWERQAGDHVLHAVRSTLEPVSDLISVATVVRGELIVVRHHRVDPRLKDQVAIARNLVLDRFGIHLLPVVASVRAVRLALRRRADRWTVAYWEGLPLLGSWDDVSSPRRGGGTGSGPGPGGPSTRTGAG
jgi:hypothetical protein